MNNKEMKDFSIREEVRIALVENDLLKQFNIEEILRDVESDETMLSAITLAVYETILNKLKENNLENEEVDYRILLEREFLINKLISE